MTGTRTSGTPWRLGVQCDRMGCGTCKHVTQLLTGTVVGTPEMLDRLARSVGLKIVLAEGDPAPALPGRRTSRRRKPREGNPSFEAALSEQESTP